jgi:hypothetical protein
LHSLSPGLLLAYHGCDKSVAERLLGGEPFKASNNTYDWLGRGIYFWESNPKRAFDFASELAASSLSSITQPDVVGVVVSLGFCLDLTTKAGLDTVAIAHAKLAALFAAAEDGRELPKNHPDLLRRFLDCAVINLLHEIRQDAGETPFDSVRGVFVEGEPIYPTSGFHHKTHIQLAILNPDCIKAVFRVRPQDLE